MNDHPNPDHDRPGLIAILLPFAAFGFTSLLPMPLLRVGRDATAMLSWMGFVAMLASLIFAIIVAVHSWRDRPARRNRALGGLVAGLLLSAFYVLGLIEVNRKHAAAEKRLEQRREAEAP